MSITPEEKKFLMEQSKEAHEIAQSARRDVEIMSVGLDNFTAAVTANTKVNTELQKTNTDILIELKGVISRVDGVEREVSKNTQARDEFNENKQTFYLSSKILSTGIKYVLLFILGVILVASIATYVSINGKPTQIQTVKK